jgi:ubiquinone/menaquinone biosynthesis C-methylase UbiE/uncharacterized protein YbaR (Trm112 family)
MTDRLQRVIRLSQTIQDLLWCPNCHGPLVNADDHFECSHCGSKFPFVDGVPVLLNEKSSVFSIEDFVAHRKTFFDNRRVSRLRTLLRGMIPNISKNVRGDQNFRRLAEELLRQTPSPRVLVVGGSELGEGMMHLARTAAIDLVESDVSFGPRTMLISDAHDIPFEDRSFDGVVVQAVLEHVVDPYRCSAEIFRVLKDKGLVYSETPFIQQVHGGRYDFTRFTHLGHRRLFRNFEEIDSGATCGPGMALSWSYQYFLSSFATSRRLRTLLKLFANATSFYLKYFDYYLIDKPGVFDSASGFYFIGRKVDSVVPDKELLSLYRGLV